MSRSRKRVLALNAGSSTFKWTAFGPDGETVDSGSVGWTSEGVDDRRRQLRSLIASFATADAVGHRLVHGGHRYRQTTRIDPEVCRELRAVIPLAPTHLPIALEAIDVVAAALPGVPQFACFDTTFHSTIPDAAATYALPLDWTRRWGLRRFGFHGLSVEWAVRQTPAVLGRLPPRMVVCHLGSGCSVTAVRGGRSLDTTMGFTPGEGPAMATRSGSLDPGLILDLQIAHGIGAAELREALERHSGLLGMSGISGDVRLVREAALAGNADAVAALDTFIWSLRRAVGSMVGVLGGADAIAFTGGIGEHQAWVRSSVVSAIPGCRLDEPVNAANVTDRPISTPDAGVAALVIPSREDGVIRDDVLRRLAAEPVLHPN